jgi:hypothetical protein
MSPRTIEWNRLVPVLMFLIVAFTSFCSQRDVYEGIYISQEEESSKHAGSKLELMEKGQAVWRVPDHEVSFRWDIKGSEIWLSTKSGGIIIGKIHGDTIEITLPGAKKMSLKKTRN